MSADEAVDYGKLIVSSYDKFANLMYDHQEIVAIAVTTVIVFAASLYTYDHRRKWIKKARKLFHIKRGEMMSKEDHMILQRLRAANIITDALEDAVFHGRLKQSFVNHVYKQLAHIFNDKSFRNRKLPKDQQVSREEVSHILKLLFDRKPMNIPGAKPGEVDNVHVHSKKEKRKFGDKARHKG